MKKLLSFVSVAIVTVSAARAGAPPVDSAAAGLECLRRGNEAYVAAQTDVSRWGSERRVAVASGQHPFASVLTCADSRVPPELIFSQGLGDLFVVRTAGAVADRAVLGSLEYAAEHLHVPLLVVMGHSSCGAVKAAMESHAPSRPDPAGLNLEHILSAIRPSLPRAARTGNPWRNAVYASVEQNLSDVIRLSPVLAEMGREGKVRLVGAFYDLESGKVQFSAPVVIPAARGAERPAGRAVPEAHQ